GDLRRRPGRVRDRGGRARSRAANVPGAAAELPRLRAVLPVYARTRAFRRVEPTGRAEGPPADRRLRHTRGEGDGLDPGEPAAGRPAPRDALERTRLLGAAEVP